MWGLGRTHPEESESGEQDITGWAKKFWTANAATTRCVRLREVRSDEDDHEEGPVDDVEPASAVEESPPPGDLAPGAAQRDGAHLRQFAMDLFSSYVEAP